MQEAPEGLGGTEFSLDPRPCIRTSYMCYCVAEAGFFGMWLFVEPTGFPLDGLYPHVAFFFSARLTS